MGKKLDAIIGRNSKQTSKLKALFNFCVSRITILRNQHQTRCSQARGDIAQLLQLGLQDRALFRAEQVIKEQNLLDVFVMIEGYCNLLTERVVLLEYQIECPDELREAISSLIFAASRSGELPELQDIRRKFADKFGREFASSAVNLLSDCRVNPMMIQKLSTRQPSLENKSRIIREIALEKGIEIGLDTEELPIEIKELVDTEISPSKKGKNLSQNYSANSSGVEQAELYLESMEARKKYNSAGSATDHAAVTAEKKADELSNSEYKDDKSWGSPNNGLREKSPVRRMNEDENIAVHTVPSCRKESRSSSRNSIRLDTRKSREEFVVPPVERSPSVFSLLDSNKPHFQVKRTILNEQDDTESNAIESVPDVNEIEDQKTYSSGNQSDKRYGIGGVSSPTRRLMRFAVINRNSFQLHNMINAALDEEFHDKHEVVERPPSFQKKNSRKLRDTSLNDEIDKNELQLRNYSSPIDEERSQSDNFHHDSTASPAQQSKVPNKPDPMRTRRRFHR